jgi:hypothetical protein
MSLLGFDALGRWPIGQLPVNGNVALLAAAASFTVAAPANTFRIVDSQSSGSFAFSGIASRLNIGGTSGVGSFSLTGTSIAFKLSDVVAVGGYVVTGIASRDLINGAINSAGAFKLTATGAALSIGFFVSAIPFASEGSSAVFDRDFVNWAVRPAAGDDWNAEVGPASTWNAVGLPSLPWSNENAPKPDWSPLSPPSNLWTIDPAQQIPPPVSE